MTKKLRIRSASVLVKALSIAIVLLALVSCNTASPPGQGTTVTSTTGTNQSSLSVPNATEQSSQSSLSTLTTGLPTPVQTYAPIINPTYPTYPTFTPLPYTPEPSPTLPPPPPPVSITPAVAGVVSSTAHGKARSGSSSYAIAWGVETSNSLTIWTGDYSDVPSPNISNTKAVARWDSALRLIDIAASPDGRALVVLSTDILTPGSEGLRPHWLSVIDLSTGKVQAIPDLSHADLYEYYYYRPPQRIIGWIDNNRFAVQQIGDDVAMIASKDGTSYSRVPFPPQYSGAIDTALSPDRTTFFSVVVGNEDGLWLYSIDGNNPRRVLEISSVKPPYDPLWSPDGRYISFLSPSPPLSEGWDFKHMSLWLLDLDTSVEKQATQADDVWGDPAWAPDGSKIAFLRAVAASNDPDVSYKSSEKVHSNIFIADLKGLTPSKLTKFSDAKNSGLEWTPDGNIVLSSTAGTINGLPGIIVVYTRDGSTEKLLEGSNGESLVHPVIFSR